MSTTKKISYLDKTFNDYVKALEKFTKEYYPDIMTDMSDASVGKWFQELIASIGDNLSFSIDKNFSETQIDQAQERRSLMAIARTQGLKIGGKSASVCEVEFSCVCPMGVDGSPDENYLPLLKRGTQATANGNIFELDEDVDFRQQFDINTGYTNRSIIPKRDSNNIITGYTVTKTALMYSKQTKFFQKVLSDYNIQPFFEVILPENNVLSVDSIIIKEGTNFSKIPNNDDFYSPVEYVKKGYDGKPTWRYFEVDSLLEDKIFNDYTVPYSETDGTLPTIDVVAEQIVNMGKEVQSGGIVEGNLYMVVSNNPNSFITYNGIDYANDEKFIGSKEADFIKSSDDIIIKEYTQYQVSIVKGMWRMVTQKYITEYTDKGYLKIIFGAGSNFPYETEDDTFGQKVISQIINNKNMGMLPQPNTTMFIRYSVGGGSESNISRGVLRTLTTRNVFVSGTDQSKVGLVVNSLKVINTSPSTSGRDEPTVDEIRMMIKYNNQAQERCVTLKDYYDRIMKMPSRYGRPYRIGIVEKNNQILISVLSQDQNKKLTNNISKTLLDNMTDYLSEYKNLDYVVVKPGKIVNLQFEVDIIVDKSYNRGEVLKNVIKTTEDFISVDKHKMGDNIYISELTRQISTINGVTNLIELRVYNIYSDGYSNNRVLQPTINGYWDETGNWVKENNLFRKQIDLKATDGILFSESDSMFECKIPNLDIKIRMKIR
ncbi:MAG: hypothetical protein M0R03_20955 [Novosphingobium sp.]|nr:hypothetical protein [Novosphingobium sp.]